MGPSPGRNGDLVGVHREGKRNRSATMGKRAQHLRKLIDIGAAAAELRRNAGLVQPGGLQRCIILGHELVFVGGFVGAAGEQGLQLARDIDRAASLRGASVDRSDGTHGPLHGSGHARAWIVADAACSIPVHELYRLRRYTLPMGPRLPQVPVFSGIRRDGAKGSRYTICTTPSPTL